MGAIFKRVKCNFAATAAPTDSDGIGAGYSVGSSWVDITNNKAYVCVDDDPTTAIWTETTQSGGGGGSDISCRVVRTDDQTISNATETAIQFNATDDYDTDTMHDPASNNTRITATTAGKYDFGGSVRFASDSTGFRYAVWEHNGTTRVNALILVPASSTIDAIPAMGDYDMAASDYMELKAYQNSGGDLALQDIEEVGQRAWAHKFDKGG